MLVLQEVRVTIDRNAPVPTLPDMADRTEAVIERSRVRERNALHKRRKDSLLQGLEEEVHMVRHEDEVVEANGELLLVPDQEIEVCLIITFRSKDGVPPIPTIDDVVEDVRLLDA